MEHSYPIQLLPNTPILVKTEKSLQDIFHILELGVAGVSREGDHVSDVLDARCKHHQTLKAQAEASVLDRAVAPATGK